MTERLLFPALSPLPQLRQRRKCLEAQKYWGKSIDWTPKPFQSSQVDHNLLKYRMNSVASNALPWRDSWPARNDIFAVMSECILGISGNEPHALPDFSSNPRILVTSDYSGTHKQSDYRVLSFLLVGSEGGDAWERARQDVRSRVMKGDSRRISYKDINDAIVKRALPDFLAAADLLPGLSFTVAIDKRIASLVNNGVPEEFSHWQAAVFSSALDITHVVTMLIAGLSVPGQHVTWVTDEDEIAANDQRMNELTKMLMTISAVYLPHRMGDLQCATTALDNGNRQLEDFAAIPDLIAGCLSEVLTRNPVAETPASTSVVVPVRLEASTKTRRVLRWYTSDQRQPLKRLLCVLSPNTQTGLIDPHWPLYVRISGLGRSPYVL